MKFRDYSLSFRVRNTNDEAKKAIAIQYLVLKDTLRERQNTLTLQEWGVVRTLVCLRISIPISAHAGGLCTYSDTLTGCWGLVSDVN